MLGVPSEAIFPNRIREPSIFILLILKGIMHDLAIECPVREIRQSDKRRMRDVGRGRFSQRPLVAINELRPVRKVVVPDEHPFFPPRPVVVDLEGVDANLGLEEGGRIRAVEERDRVVARTVVVHARMGG